ncbi:reticulon-like protein B12 isoform X2 [Hordeum vulgare subsp. vulgare]|uniref:reticulon-like protein B12 isoform X2 n=1 Tax=Hordeum vulgare subsp. vulgare TaxID=112509 RepID=UPI001D1A3F60|nr:reticulon-like protein B12 isoform X2 [Hordeum vulgare subsp. vulgare]
MAATQHRPLHALLGGGAGTHAPPSSALSLPIRPICGADRPCPAAPRRAADLLLWRRRNASATAVTGATLVWFVFERAGYSLASVLSNALLLLVIILFFWAKSASLLNSGTVLPPVQKTGAIRHRRHHTKLLFCCQAFLFYPSESLQIYLP